MTHLEQVQQSDQADNSIRRPQGQDHAGQRFLSEIYEPAIKDKQPGQVAQSERIARSENGERPVQADKTAPPVQADKPTKPTDDKKDSNIDRKPTTAKASNTLEKEGNVESLKLPNDFTLGAKDKSTNFVQFNGSQKDTKVCYMRRDDFSADEEDSTRIDDVLKKQPHVLNEQETLDVMPMMMPGRPWGNGNYKDLSLASADIDGRRVLVADFKLNGQDKRVHLIIANQNSDKHQIENVWLEAPNKDFEKSSKAIVDAIQQIKWTKKAEK